MKKKIIIALVLIAVVFAGVMVIKKKKAELANMPLPERALLPVRAVSPVEGDFPATKRYLATVKPKEKADIAPRMSGRIFDVTVREGQKVKKGQLLALIDDRQIRQKIDEIKAQLAAARTNYETQQGIYERDLRLFKAKAISKEQLDRSRAQRDAARAQVAVLKSSLLSQQVELSYARLVSPFDGIVTQRYQDPGSLAVVGKPIVSVECPEAGYFVAIKVNQVQLPKMKTGQRVTLFIDEKSKSGQAIQATISRIHPAVSVGTLATVEADLQSRPFDLPTGSTVWAEVELGQVHGWKVPLRALLENVQATYLFLVDDDSKIEVKQVKVLSKGDDWAVVDAQGLSGQKVVVAQESGLLRLHQGEKVKVVEEGEVAP